jgi:adenylate cyclase
MAEKRANPRPQPKAKPQSRRRAERRSGFPKPDGTDEQVSLTGKHLSQAALSIVMRAIPDELVREITAASAPLTRYSGRSRVGAAALSRGLKLLAQPPAARKPITGDMTASEIAERVGRPVATITRWAGAGLLGPPTNTGRVRRWGRAGLENARLVDYLLRHGVTWEILLREAREGRLPQLVLAKALGGQGGLTRDQVAKRAGVPVELAASIWRALGAAAPAEADEPVYSSAEVEALRLIGAMRAMYTDEDLIEATSVVGRAMHEVAEAVLELFRRRVGLPFAEAGGGELEIMLRLATAIDITVPTVAPLLELALRRQLEATSRAETILRYEAATGAVGGQVEMAVGFADIVGFTAASSRLSALEVSQMAETLLKCAEVALPTYGARIVKSIGDAVMFTAPDLVSACAAAASLLEAAEAAGLPPLRVGVAFGPMLRAYADYFGRTVNIASRLSDTARAGEILVLRPEIPIPTATWEARGLLVKEAGKQRLRGVDGRVEVLRVSQRR